jgi:hypothetical protein
MRKSKIMKTLILWQDRVFDGEDLTPQFLQVEGDLSKFNGIYINSGDNESLEEELLDFMYKGEAGLYRYDFSPVPTKDWGIFIHCGFLT